MSNENREESGSPRDRSGSAWRRAMWFVALWVAGVGGAFLLALPFRLLLQAAMH